MSAAEAISTPQHELHVKELERRLAAAEAEVSVHKQLVDFANGQAERACAEAVEATDRADALEEKLRQSNPCQSCGADPSVSPPTGEDLPIIKGALDAQADAERRCATAQQDAILWKGEADRLKAEIDEIRLSIGAPDAPTSTVVLADAAAAPALRDELRAANRRADAAIEMAVAADKANKERDRLALQLNALGGELLELRQIEGRRRRQINELESKLALEQAEVIGAVKTIAEMGTQLRDTKLDTALLQAASHQCNVTIDEIDRLRAVNNQLAQAQRGKLILAEVDVREPKNPRLLVLVAPDTPDEAAAALILQHLGPALGVDPRRVVQQLRRAPPHSEETAEEAKARDGVTGDKPTHLLSLKIDKLESDGPAPNSRTFACIGVDLRGDDMSRGMQVKCALRGFAELITSDLDEAARRTLMSGEEVRHG